MSRLKVLSPTLLEVLREAAKGWTCNETGDHLGKSGDTVKRQRQDIINLWNANNIVHAVAMGIRGGVIK